jgi:hypothetical protein
VFVSPLIHSFKNLKAASLCPFPSPNFEPQSKQESKKIKSINPIANKLTAKAHEMFKIFRGRDTTADSSPQSSYSPSSSSSLSPSPSSPPVTGPARPIRLVYYDEKGKFRMDSEAVAALQLVKEPIGVVSVCGRSRQGKSFILNQVSELFMVFWLVKVWGF